MNNFSTVENYFQLSNWQSWVALIFVILSIIILTIFKAKKAPEKKVLFVAFLIGIFGGVIFAFLSSNQAISSAVDVVPEWESDVALWLNLIGTIFIFLLSFMIPLLIFTTIIKIFSSFNKGKKQSLKKNFLSLFQIFLSSIFVILLAIGFFFAFGKDIKYNDLFTEKTKIFADQLYLVSHFLFSPIILLASVSIAFVFVIVMKTMKQNNVDNVKEIERFLNNFNFFILEAIKVILKLVPFVIATSIPILFLKSFAFSYIDALLSIALILFGFAILMFFHYFFLFIFNYKKHSFKDNLKKQKEIFLFGLSNDDIEKEFLLLNETEKEKNSFFAKIYSGTTVTSLYIPISMLLITTNNSSLVMGVNFYLTLVLVVLIISIGIWETNSKSILASDVLLQSVSLSSTFFLSLFLPLTFIFKPIEKMINVNSILLSTTMIEKIDNLRIKKSKKKQVTPLLLTENTLEETNSNITEIDIYETKSYNKEKLFDDLKVNEVINILEENIEDYEEIEFDLDDINDSDYDGNVW